MLVIQILRRQRGGSRFQGSPDKGTRANLKNKVKRLGAAPVIEHFLASLNP
jgi:hypothetical protein